MPIRQESVPTRANPWSLFRLTNYTARFAESPNLKEFPRITVATDKGLPVCTGHWNWKEEGSIYRICFVELQSHVIFLHSFRGELFMLSLYLFPRPFNPLSPLPLHFHLFYFFICPSRPPPQKEFLQCVFDAFLKEWRVLFLRNSCCHNKNKLRTFP
jgi:hypothetical protein